MKHSLVILVLIVSTATSLRAQQVRLGPEAGIGFTNMAFQENGIKQKPSSLKGLRAGFIADVKVNDIVSFQPGLLYAAKGYKTSKTAIKTNNIEMPLNLQGKFLFGPGFFFVGGGPYLGYVLGGKTTMGLDGETRDQKTAIKIGSTAADDLRPLDIGMNLNTGYLVKNGIFVRANAGFGLRNLQPEGNTGFSKRNASLSFTIGYLLGK